MSTDISRVYVFLAKQEDWLNAADKNGDGTVIKSEFRDFMEANFEWDGETTDAGKNDLINNFWKSIDTNQSGKVSGTRLKNKNALDKKEIAAMENKIKMYEILNNFVDEIDAPDVIDDQYAWKKSLAESLGNFVETLIKQGGKAEDLEAKLNAELPAAKARTTADYVAKEYIEEVLSDTENYARSDDKTLKGIIDKYIAEIKKLGNENLPSAEEIQAKVKELVDAYLATAAVGDGDVTELGNYGYSPKDKSPMNDFQKAVLLTEAINAVKADAEEKARYDMSNEGYKAALSAFLDSLKYGDFKTHQGSVMELFKNSSFYNTIQEKVDEASLAKTREDAIKYCDSIYKQGGLFKDAVDNIFGSNYAQSINEMDAATIENNLSQLKEIVASYDISDMTQAEKDAMFYGIKDYYTVFNNEQVNVQLPRAGSCNGKIITSDRIQFVSTGAATIDNSTGKLTLNTNTPGIYTATIAVLIDNKQVASKTITVEIKESDVNIISENATWNLSSFKFDKVGGSSDDGVRIWGNNGTKNNTNLASCGMSFKDLYNGNYNIELGTTPKKDKIGEITSRINSIGNLVISALKSAGLNEQKLKTAVSNVAMQWLSNQTKLGEVGNNSGTRDNQRNKSGSTYNTMSENFTNGTYKGIVIAESKKGNNQLVVMINFKEFVDAILEEYNKLK